MPPELLAHQGEGYCGAKVDVWSCGMVLFACLAGFVPYTCDTGDAEAVLEQVTGWKEMKFPEWFSEGVCDLLKGALEKDPVKRIDMKGMRDHAWTRGEWVARKVGAKEEEMLKVGVDGWGGEEGDTGWSPVTPGEGEKSWK